MDTTKTRETTDSAATAPRSSADSAGNFPSDPSESTRARTYLDLWERQLVHLALHGQAAPGGGPQA